MADKATVPILEGLGSSGWQNVVVSGSESSMVGSPWPGLLMALVFGPLRVGFGLAMAKNFRGWTQRHFRMTFRIMGPVEVGLSRVPWRRSPPRPVEERIQRQIRLERWMGAAFAVAGLLMVANGVVLFGSWAI